MMTVEACGVRLEALGTLGRAKKVVPGLWRSCGMGKQVIPRHLRF
jgi:hypothetical protein